VGGVERQQMPGGVGERATDGDVVGTAMVGVGVVEGMAQPG
jgi:hypothetical protein